jgi:glycosyltransferase involved in cell wall biosynthesis
MKDEKLFLTSSRPHILMITNHGIHQWKIIPGLPDTGGQNVFVNQFTNSLAKQGYKITIINRGGYKHPVSGESRRGVHYKDENQRILYLEDGLRAFVRKEDMEERLPLLSKALENHLGEEEQKADLIISHYWDGAKLGILFNQTRENPIPHIWVPHSLGIIKKKNVNPEQWKELRIDERVENEKSILQIVDGVASTSANIEKSLREDYEFLEKTLFLPPCVNPERYYPRRIEEDHSIWAFLSQHCGLSPKEIYNSQIITEISRTDRTKRKNVLIKAFARVLKKHPHAMLAISIEQSDEELPKSLDNLIKSLGIEKRVAVLGSVWDELPDIYAVSDIYCTPSIMEGFGMTSQEAAATAVPVVASHLVPFVTEYLLGEPIEEVLPAEREQPLKIGQGAIVVQADDTNGFAHALDLLLSDPDLRGKLGEKAYQITIPYFTWDNIVCDFLQNIENLNRDRAVRQ